MLKFSLLGYGHIGRVHRNAIENTESTELISIIDPILEKDETGPKIYHSLDEFLKEDTATDIVSIATPNGFHKAHAIQCLNSGKYVLIEKPMALTTTDALEIIETAQKNNKRVFSSMQLRFSPPVQFVKQLIENGELGEIYMVNIECYWNRNENYYKQREWSGSSAMDGGVLFTQFSHFVDIMNFWFDEVKCTQSSFFNFNHKGITEFPDSGILGFEADDAKGSMVFTTSVYEKNYKSRILLLAEKGTIEIGDQYLNTLQFCNVNGVDGGDEYSTEVRNFHPLAMSEIADAIKNNRPSVLDGIHAVRLVKFIEEAHNLRKK